MAEADSVGGTTVPAGPAFVSIGVPVYNGERYLPRALEALLTQTHKNFELIICDNASTDSTREICEEHAARDPRIRYFRSPENLGSIKNFRQTFERSTGNYFMWAADDDLRHPAYIEKCLAALQANPEAVLACSHTQFIDEDGRELPKTVASFSAANASVYRRVFAAAARHGGIGGVYMYGLIRREHLVATNLMQNVWGPDIVLLMELIVRGPFAIVDERLFYYRTYQAARKDSTMELLDPGLSKSEWPYPFSDMCHHQYRAIAASGYPRARVLAMKAFFIAAVALANPRCAKKVRIEQRRKAVDEIRNGHPLQAARAAAIWIALTITGSFARLAVELGKFSTRQRTLTR